MIKVQYAKMRQKSNRYQELIFEFEQSIIKEQQKELQMDQLSSRQSSSRNFREQLNSSRQPKSIRRIRIIDSDKQTLSTEENPIPQQRSESNNAKTYRQQSCAHEFSFKKQLPQNRQLQQNRNKVSQNQIATSIEDQFKDQQQELKKLERMLKLMRKKIVSQEKLYLQVKQEYDIHDEEMGRNQQLKMEILELKDLMKELIVEKDNHRMVLFTHHN